VHESSLARQLLAMTLDRASQGHELAVAVLRVRAWIAETEALAAESVVLQFGALARGTIASGARLELDVRRVDARCAACATEFRPECHVLLCPACGAAEGELLGETGLGIEEIDVKVEDGA
jgi:hydrogenase nickel incorporation protein HypA/HybF